MTEPDPGTPLLHRRVPVPDAFTATATVDGVSLTYGGDVRIGDLTGDGRADFLVFRCAAGGTKVWFLGAFDHDGEPLWSAGSGGEQPVRPGPVAVGDLDGDGRAEVVSLSFDGADPAASDPGSMADAVVRVRDGATGAVEREAAPEAITKATGEGPDWVHQRLLLADLDGKDRPGLGLVLKLGARVVGLGPDLEHRFTYSIREAWTDYGDHTAYVPAVGDVDGDGRAEVTGGHYLLDHDGRPLFERHRGPHMDSVAITEWDDQPRVIASGGGHVLDEDGDAVLALGHERVPHGQEVRVGDFLPGGERALVVRHRGHEPDVLTVDTEGTIRAAFELAETPNNTGMTDVRWGYGPGDRDLLYDGGALWSATGERVAALPDCPEPVGPDRTGWHHCIPADVCGDAREEAVVYDPWDDEVLVYTPAPYDPDAFDGYDPGPRQYDPRLMD